MYSNFTFTTEEQWYDYYFSFDINHVIRGSMNIGNEKVKNTHIPTSIEKTVQEGQNVTSRLFGIPLSYGPIEIERLILGKTTTNINENKEVEKLPNPSESDNPFQVRFDIHLNFHIKVISIKYMTVKDIISDVGGFKSSIEPLIGLLVPWLTIKYLAKLSGIIKNHNVNKYKLLIK